MGMNPTEICSIDENSHHVGIAPVLFSIESLKCLPSILAMTSCTAIYPQLVKATLISGIMPHLAKVFIAVQGQ
jgi:hypothetical protein